MSVTRVGISFSGGGARGIAHIGVIKALREQGIEPAAISGTSAGAIVGSMYAAGLSVDQMIDFAKEGSLLKTFKWGLPVDGFASLDYLKDHLFKVIKASTFEDLQLPFYVAISNLLTGEPEIVCSGELMDTIVASCSIPLIFKPVVIKKRLYVDGGVMLNMPVEPLLPVTDVIIGVNVRPKVPIDKKEVANVFGIAQRIFDLSLQGNMRSNELLCDVVIAPPELHKYGLFQFNKWKALIDIGYQAGMESIPAILKEIESNRALRASLDMPEHMDAQKKDNSLMKDNQKI